MSVTDLATPVGQAKISAQIIAALGVTLILVVLIVWGGFYINSLQNAAAAGQQRKTTAVTTEGMQHDGTVAAAEAQHVEVTVRTARETYNQEKANDPSAAARDARPVPDSLRELARKRRLARERSGRAAAERAARGETNDPAER